MKKNFTTGIIFCFFLTGCLLAEAKEAKNIMTSEIKEAKIIDDTKMQPIEELNFDKKAEEQAKKEAKAKQKEIKKQEKTAAKQAKKEAKEKQKEIKTTTKQIKEENPKDNKKEEIVPVVEISKKIIEKKTVEEEFKGLEIKEDETKEAKKEEILEAKEEKLQEIKEEKELVIEEKREKIETQEPKTQTAELHKRNLTFEDIDKNAVSINEFLQFTDKQNERFSIFYYKTTSKLNAYTKAIEKKEAEAEMVKRSKLAIKAQAEKLSKLEKEIDYLYKERDGFYNKSLKKFDSMLTKKQSIKWELLQQMGYRFFPEF